VPVKRSFAQILSDFSLGSEFLRNLHWNGFKPDRHINPNSRATSSGLKTTGILRGSRTKVRYRAISGRSSVTVKKKRSAATELLILGGQQAGGCVP